MRHVIALAVLPAAALVVALPGCQKEEPAPPAETVAAPPPATEPAPTAATKGAERPESAKERPYPAAKGTVVKLITDRGEIVMELYDDKMPATVRHFTQLVADEFYDGRAFYRVEDWVIQAGAKDPPPDVPKLRFETSPDCMHDAGAVGMARTSDPNSASSEFYIVKRDAHELDDAVRQRQTGGRERGYACFGRVIEGMDVVQTTVPDDRIIAAYIVQEPG
jgi:cyclophilin family peptidyl-prolyl cis-trans isomerase